MSLVPTPDTLAAEIDWRYGAAHGTPRFAPPRPARAIVIAVRAGLRDTLVAPPATQAVADQSAERATRRLARRLGSAVASS